MKKILIIATAFISLSGYAAVRSAVKTLSKEADSTARAAKTAVPPQRAALTNIRDNLEQAKGQLDQARNNFDEAQAKLDDAIEDLPEKRRLDDFMESQPTACVASIDDAVAARRRQLNTTRSSGRQGRRQQRNRNTGAGANAASGVQ